MNLREFGVDASGNDVGVGGVRFKGGVGYVNSGGA